MSGDISRNGAGPLAQRGNQHRRRTWGCSGSTTQENNQARDANKLCSRLSELTWSWRSKLKLSDCLFGPLSSLIFLFFSPLQHYWWVYRPYFRCKHGGWKEEEFMDLMAMVQRQISTALSKLSNSFQTLTVQWQLSLAPGFSTLPPLQTLVVWARGRSYLLLFLCTMVIMVISVL